MDASDSCKYACGLVYQCHYCSCLLSACKKEEDQERNQDFGKPQRWHKCYHPSRNCQRPSGTFTLLWVSLCVSGEGVCSHMLIVFTGDVGKNILTMWLFILMMFVMYQVIFVKLKSHAPDFKAFLY